MRPSKSQTAARRPPSGVLRRRPLPRHCRRAGPRPSAVCSPSRPSRRRRTAQLGCGADPVGPPVQQPGSDDLPAGARARRQFRRPGRPGRGPPRVPPPSWPGPVAGAHLGARPAGAPLGEQPGPGRIRSARPAADSPRTPVRPGSTSGPTTPVASTTPAYRCGCPGSDERLGARRDRARAPPRRPVGRRSPASSPRLSGRPDGSLGRVRGGRPRRAARRAAPAGPRRRPAARRRRRRAARPAPRPTARPGRRPARRPRPPPPPTAAAATAAPTRPAPRTCTRSARRAASRLIPRPAPDVTSDREARSGRSRSRASVLAPQRVGGRRRRPSRRPAARPAPAAAPARSLPVRQTHAAALLAQQRQSAGAVEQFEEAARRRVHRAQRHARAPVSPRTAPSCRSRQPRRSAGFTIGCMPVSPVVFESSRRSSSIGRESSLDELPAMRRRDAACGDRVVHRPVGDPPYVRRPSRRTTRPSQSQSSTNRSVAADRHRTVPEAGLPASCSG